MKHFAWIIGGLAFCILPFSSCKQQTPGTGTDSTLVIPDTNQARMIVAKVFIKPEKTDSFIMAARGIIQNSNAEPGCEFYQLYQDPYDKTKFVFVERYVNQAAVEAHFNADYFKAFGPSIASMVSNPAEINIVSVARDEKK
ncbi:MAG: putative quinol monooxygenase [Bacteroidales bacterium]